MFDRKLSQEAYGAPSVSARAASLPALSAADPEALARVVREHKLADVMAQAFLTIALILAIGAVMLVLGVDRAAAAGLAAVNGSLDAVGVLPLALVMGGFALLFLVRPLKTQPVRVRRERRPPFS